MFDVIIIGGGIVGACIARELSKFKLDVVLLEKEPECSFGVSKSNSGIVHTGFQSPADTLKAKLAVRGNELYSQLALELNFPLHRVGELIVASSAEKTKLLELYNNAQELCIPGVSIVDRNWLIQNEPALLPDIEWALLGETAGITNPYEIVYALIENAQANELIVKCEEKVLGIQRNDLYWEIKTSKDIYSTKFVINAAGLFADEVSRLAGVKCEDILPRKGQEFLLDRHHGYITRRVIFPLPKEHSKGILIIPTVDHNTMIGPTAEDVQDKTDLSTTVEGKQKVIKSIQELIAAIHEKTIIASFAGLRPVATTDDFHIREDKEGFINCLGIQSPGLTAAPAIAEMVVSMIRQTLRPENKDSFQPFRQAIPRFRDMTHEQRNELVLADPDYGEVVCRCELVTRAEIKEAVRRGAKTLDGIKFRTRCQMGRCHGSFCTMKIMTILRQELGIAYSDITKRGAGTNVVL
ncbi:MAG: NAD(P)/FAD-dependent oxidoreductase [Candidatus Margulisbacteria bacterium]|nr:NAD(P)/FAD-dependent oxidoreductase [Candidatus Margulisiibacteriota bacterium]